MGAFDKFDWIINEGATSSKGTGPDVDHTTTSLNGIRRYTVHYFTLDLRILQKET